MSGSQAPTQTSAEAQAKFGAPVPRAVREAAELSEAIQRELNGVGDDPPEGGEEQPGAPPQPQQAPPPQQPSPPAGEEQTWEQRARSALGRLEQANSGLQAANQRIDQLEGLLASMQIQGKAAGPATTPVKVELLTPEERDEYGDPMLDIMGRRAREEIDPEIQGLKATIANLETRLNGVGTVIQKQQTRTVYDTLADNIPEWQQINRSPEFIEWSKEIEPYSGQPRNKLIREAFDRHEGERVVRFFQGFLSEAAALDPTTAQPGSRTAPAPAAGNGKIPLEAFAAPGRARSAPPELPPEKPTYTRAAITQFWSDKRRGLWKGREAEADKMERDIFLAQHEGRITP